MREKKRKDKYNNYSKGKNGEVDEKGQVDKYKDRYQEEDEKGNKIKTGRNEGLVVEKY